MVTIWLLDIDGVINANRPGWGGPPRRIHLDYGLTIRWAPALIDRIRSVHTSGLARVTWSTTWCGYPDQLAGLARTLRLDLHSAFGDRPAHLTFGDLKAQAALKVIRAGHRLIWTDDDEVGAGRALFPEIALAEQNGQALLIAPRSNRGLQPEDMDNIEKFVAQE